MSDASDATGRWTRVSSRTIHQTPWLKLREDTVALPDGRTTPYGVVECGDCVGVLPFVDAERVILVRQYRYIAGRYTWEMPTGGVHPGESLVEATQRELAEEAGYHAGELGPLASYHTSKSSMDETAHLFVGRQLTPATATPDDTEFIERRIFPFSTVLDMVRSGQITDSMTIIAALHVALGAHTQV